MSYETPLNEVIQELKDDEGFKGYEYRDHLGFPTIGYGTRLPLTEEEGELLLNHRLHIMVKELQASKPFIDTLPLDAKIILLNMTYQLGVPRLLLFVKMWAALETKDFKTASIEMKNSKWNRQTPNRSNKLASIMSNVSYA